MKFIVSFVTILPFAFSREVAPSSAPTKPPSPEPSPFPTARPSASPSETPSDLPSRFPTVTPSRALSQSPSDKPSAAPTRPPSPAPSPFPTARPSASPSETPSHDPSDHPTENPTDTPTDSIKPSPSPSASPTIILNNTPSLSCNDSPLKVHKKDCSIVAKKKKLCEKVSSHCPLTCYTCDVCNDSKLKFELLVVSDNAPKSKKDKKKMNCKEVAKNADEFCALPGISETCRASCGRCF